MNEDLNSIDLEAMQAAFLEGTRWASLEVSIEDIAKDNSDLVKELSKYDLRKTTPLLASLLTLPEYQSNCLRLEILVALAVSYCKGKKKPGLSDVGRWFYKIGKSKCAFGEDPAEDVFVSLVNSSHGDYRLLEGVWEATGFYTQAIIDVVSLMPDTEEFRPVKRSIKSMLIISDFICEQSKLTRYQLGADEVREHILVSQLPMRKDLISRVNIPFSYLDDCGVEPNDLAPFLYHPSMGRELIKQEVGNSFIEKHPLAIFSEDSLTVLMPTAISVAIREFVIEMVIENGFVDSFDRAIAKVYTRYLTNNPLLGGPLRAPVSWKINDGFRSSAFSYKADEGHFILFHFSLPSIIFHGNGGFKEMIEDDEEINEDLKKAINSFIGQFTKDKKFKRALIISVGCGWGKGRFLRRIISNNPQLKLEYISAADLVRLSFLKGMNPSYFWQLQDGLVAIENEGVSIRNPNGVLNLIGWVRKNDGHFVPHAQLPQAIISPQKQLNLQIPSNLLRSIRSDADQGIDKHTVADNIGVFHQVQQEAPEFLFTSESARKTFISITDVEKGVFTSVYEGKFKLWISVKAENIKNNGLEYQLWQMSHEWLHRIGREIDKFLETDCVDNIFKVYADFRDHTPSDLPTEKPTEISLNSCCHFDKLNENCAATAIFDKGFLDGFQIAENVAERLYVFNVLSAFLMLFGEKDYLLTAYQLLPKIVENCEARSFHSFQAHHFIDYVRHLLPEALVEIDDISDGIAKLGLGWKAKRLLGQDDENNKVIGQQECKVFLGSVIDILISEISSQLKRFDRKNSILKLLENCEKANSEENYWTKTSAAILGLHGKTEKTFNAYVEQASKVASSGIASRILIEMAICMCPITDGEDLSNIELTRLLAQASLLVRYGGLSDAIRFNALPAELHISALGDILFTDEFGDVIVQPMLTKVSEQKFVGRAANQAKNYDSPSIVASSQNNFGIEFWEIWNEEMGFSIDEARNIIGMLEDFGIDQNKVIFEITKNEFLNMVCARKIPLNVAENFLAQFTLATRNNWDRPPKEFSIEEIYPWRFGRRLSVVTRPILEIECSDDPLLIIAPSTLRKGFAYFVDGTFAGRFRQVFYRTNKMKNEWWGKASEGHTFNTEAANKLRSSGWVVRENIGLPEIFNQKLDRNYGDVDILAWKPGCMEVLAIECKDLSLARNYSEIAALLSIFQGEVDKNGKGDKLKVHLDRIELLEQNLSKVAKYTELQNVKIVSCLAFSGIVPMQFAKIDALSGSVVKSVEGLISLFSAN